jgi:hypothetical protein
MNNSIILVHTGESQVPDYLFINLEILRRLNSTITIFLIIDKINIDYYFKKIINYKIKSEEINLIISETIIESASTTYFKLNSSLDPDFRDGFWKNTSLRFFLINDFISQYSLTNILHIENDYLLFVDPLKIINVCAQLSDFMVPLDNSRAIPGIVWFKNSLTTQKLVTHLSENVNYDDMKNLGDFSLKYNYSSFPTIPVDYCIDRNLDQFRFSTNFNIFNGIFDAAAIGQFIGGVHWLNDNSNTIFFQNENSSLILKSEYLYWAIEDNIRFLCFRYKDVSTPIIGLHIHSKNLIHFSPFNRLSLDSANDIITGENIQSLTCLTIASSTIVDFHGIDKIKSKDLLIFKQLSEYQYIAPNSLNIELVNSSKIIFIYTHFLDFFIQFILPRISEKFILITHNSDYEINENYLILLNSPFLTVWFAQNILFSHNKLLGIPIGIQNSQWNDQIKDLIFTKSKKIHKSKLIYANFNPTTHFSRDEAMSIAHKLPFCTLEFNVSSEIYLTNLAMHKFSICPRGNGIDTHRFWESQYLDVIPIIIKSEWTQAYSNFPCLILNDWDQLLYLDLNKEYLKIKNYSYNYSFLSLSKFKSFLSNF